jgi:hypothetical protein
MRDEAMRFDDKLDLLLNEVFDRDPQKLKNLGIEPVVNNGDYDYVFRDPKLGAKSPYYRVNIANYLRNCLIYASFYEDRIGTCRQAF